MTILASSPTNGFIPTKDAKKARDFYEKLLGLPFEDENKYVLTFRTKYAMIVVQKVEELTPSPHTVLGWEVDNIEETVSFLTKQGVVFERYAWMEQDKLGIWNSPDGKVAWFKDPDGNTLSVSSH